ncbi:MAG TPA: pyruvate formate lyase family protein [Bacillota bacterium]|jgi:formate C-acetyltransferase
MAVPPAPQCEIWSEGKGLSPRIRRLRQEYFSFRDRPYFRNEVRPYTTGVPWDFVYSPHNWGVVPETYVFFPSFSDSLLAMAERVDVPADLYGRPIPVRRALFFNLVLEKHLPVQILDRELIVGGQFNTALSRTLGKAEAARWRKAEDAFVKRVAEAHNAGIGNAGAVPGHLIPNYKKVLEKGFKGIAAEVDAAIAALGPAPSAAGRRAALESFRLSCEAPRIIARRYAEEARRLATTEPGLARRAELEAIAAKCDRVPWEPAGDFWEALQSLWFTHMLVMAAESYPGAGLSHGRVDQYLYPYFHRDLNSGRLTRDQARELLEAWWIKHNYAYDYQGRVGTNQGINSGFGQLLTVGGLGPDGRDASNDLTRLIIEVIEEMNLLEPKPNIRLHRGTPDDLLDRIVEAVARAQGAPFLLNFDENAIAALRTEGLPEELLWDYAPVGCLENTLQGCDRSGTVDANVNLAKAVELALNDGRDLATGRQFGPRTGDPLTFHTYDQFLSAVKAQLLFVCRHVVELAAEADAIRSRFEPTPYLSLLVDGCVEQGRDVTNAGARFNFITLEGVGLATLADSVAAVRRLVYDDRRLPMADLVRALKDNFQGHEELQDILVNHAPKFGNDDPYADGIARELSSLWTEEALKHTSPATGRRFRGGYLSWNYWIGYAPLLAATPDGRPRGRALSNGVCPVAGRDESGPTAVIRSVGSLGLASAPNGASHTMSFSRAVLADPEHRRKFAALLRAYGEVGGTALQINILDADTLRAAQAHPDDYRNLLVRVTGYNAYFVNLGRELQDELIARESHRA